MKGKKALLLGLMVFCAVILAAVPASAQVGFYLGTGIGVGSPAWSGDLNDSDPQAGLGLELIHLGYNFTDNLGIGLQWGSIAGELDGEFYDWDIDEGTYGEGYLALSGRYTFADVDFALKPYVELGIGQYAGLGELEIDGTDVESTIDPQVGYRLAVGGLYYMNNFYIAPELSYHIVEFDDVEYDIDGIGKVDEDGIGDGNFMLLAVKVGYHFKK